MVTKVIMEKLAENTDEATIGQWFKREGERVEEGEPLFEAITDKASVEVPAPASGVLRKVLAPASSVVPVGQVIAFIAEPEDELPSLAEPRPQAPKPERRAIKASFGARRLARELGIDLATVTPARADGRITEDDVRRAAARAVGPPVLERRPLGPLKRAVVAHLSKGATGIPVASVALEVSFEAVQRALPQLSRSLAAEVEPRDVVLWLAARLLPEHRLLNAALADDAVILYEPINIGLAVDTEQEAAVAVAVIHDADKKSLGELAAEAGTLSEKARSGHLAPEDLANATFTVVDHGSLGLDSSIPLLGERQSASLAIGAIAPRPVARGERLVVAQTATLTVAFDHRVVNATVAAAFLRALKERLENFQPAEAD